MRVAVEVKIGQIGKRFLSPPPGHLTDANQAPQSLRDFDVHQVRDMPFVVVAKEAGLDACAKRRLQEELQESRSVDNDHAESRSSRMITAAGVLSPTRVRLWSRASISSRVGREAR